MVGNGSRDWGLSNEGVALVSHGDERVESKSKAIF